MMTALGRRRDSGVAASLTGNGRGGEAGFSGIIQEKIASEILAQNDAGHARMMPFDAPVWPIRR